ncbi:MAG: hypothetical protein KAT58_11215, partial [candidate division Zixibacteria bacterium]|nr:hypothetical protein [candidate division Zixibacteria bacterium]
AMIAAAVTLGSYFRQHDQYDSAHFYAGQALFWAQETGDTFDLAIATVGLGFSAMELDSLKRARYLFWQVADISADSYPGFTDLARIGLGDCFYRRGELDSCLAYIAPIEKIYRQRPANPTFAYAAHLLGKVYRDQGHDAEAIEKLTDSYLTWHALGGFADLIENLNDLADIYLQQHEYNNSRKYYVAASQLAQIYDLEQKNRYNINLDSRISARLTPEEYVRAGKEGEALAQEITQGREPIQ